MYKAPLGEVLSRLSLLTADDVDRVLGHMHQTRERFGEAALDLGLIDEDALARALAAQLDVGCLHGDRLDDLELPGDVLAMLPPSLMRDQLLLPLSLDPETGILSLVVADPSDKRGLAAARKCTRASKLKLYVAPRARLAERIDQVTQDLPEDLPVEDRPSVFDAAPEPSSASPSQEESHFLLDLARFFLLASEQKNLQARARCRKVYNLCRKVGQELGLEGQELACVALAGLLVDIDQLSIVRSLVEDSTKQAQDMGRFELPVALCQTLDCPYEIAELFRSLQTRLEQQDADRKHRGAEVVFTVRELVDMDMGSELDPSRLLGAELTRHDPRVLGALRRVLEREKQLRSATAQKLGLASTTPLILLADSDSTLLTAMEVRLSNLGFETIMATDGSTALQLAQTLRPSLIVANMRLPKRDGLTLLLDLENHPATRKIPVLLLTDRSDPRDMRRGKDLGAVDVLQKPLNLQHLADVLWETLSDPED